MEDTAQQTATLRPSVPTRIVREFRSSTSISQRWCGWEAQPLDVDKWEIAMSPTYYGEQFNTGLATVQLSSHTPRRPAIRNGQPVPYFYNWLLLAESGHQLWIEQTTKEDFIERLKYW